MIDIKRVQEHVRVADQWGRNARQELSADEVTEVCRNYLHLLDTQAITTQELNSAYEASDKLLEQRDRANGKLSAAQRKIKNLEAVITELEKEADAISGTNTVD